MNFLTNYALDSETIKLNAYRLLCLFFTNKEIARQADPASPDDPLSLLEQHFFASEVTKLLLDIAISIRVLDDQMNRLPSGDPKLNAYLRVLSEINKHYNCMMFDQLPLREVCNKIIHATTVEPHVQEASESHKEDGYNLLGWSEAMEQSKGEAGPEPAPVKWRHLAYIIRLGGTKNGEKWSCLLEVPVFVEAVCQLLV
jgi:hypothetical protein